MFFIRQGFFLKKKKYSLKIYPFSRYGISIAFPGLYPGLKSLNFILLSGQKKLTAKSTFYAILDQTIRSIYFL
jgi:hypothetical protein